MLHARLLHIRYIATFSMLFLVHISSECGCYKKREDQCGVSENLYCCESSCFLKLGRPLTLTDSEPARIFPHDIASSGRAPESDPSNSCPVFYDSGEISKVNMFLKWTYYENRVVGPIALMRVQTRLVIQGQRLTISMALAI